MQHDVVLRAGAGMSAGCLCGQRDWTRARCVQSIPHAVHQLATSSPGRRIANMHFETARYRRDQRRTKTI